MRSDEYHRLGVACVTMAGQSSNFSADAKNRWFKLARTCSILEHEAAENRVAPRASRMGVGRAPSARYRRDEA
jgi:hypothetical protein